MSSSTLGIDRLNGGSAAPPAVYIGKETICRALMDLIREMRRRKRRARVTTMSMRPILDEVLAANAVPHARIAGHWGVTRETVPQLFEILGVEGEPEEIDRLLTKHAHAIDIA